jgi:hypothetical protein
VTYQYFDRFPSGMVRTRARHSGPLGSVWTASNCVINRGNEIVRRQPFRLHKSLPEGVTYGGFLYGGLFYVFGSEPEIDVTTPDGVIYVRLRHPFDAPMSEILDVEPFFGKLYVIAKYGDGAVYHFYNGERVTDWDHLTSSYASLADIATALASKINSTSQFIAAASGNFLDITGHNDSAFILTATGKNGGIVPDENAVVSEVTPLGALTTAVSAQGSLTVASGSPGTVGQVGGTIAITTITDSLQHRVDSIKVNGVELLSSPAVVAEDFNPNPKKNLGQILQSLININTGTTGFSATFDNVQTLTIQSADVSLAGQTPVITSTHCTLTPIALSGSVVNTNYVSSITVSGTELLGALVPYQSNQTTTAAAIAAAINAFTPTSGYAATSAAGVVTIIAPPGLGDTVNGATPTASTTGTFVINSPVNMAGGVTGGAAQQQKQRIVFSGTFEITDSWTVTINGTPYTVQGDAFQPGRTAMTLRKKVYSVSGSTIVFSALRDAMNFSSGIGAGFLNASGEKYGDLDLTVLAEYAGSLAAFAKQTVYIFHMEEDEDLNQLLYTLENIGTIAPESVKSFGQRDVFFLAWSGVRSLRSHSVNDNAYVSDVGTPIDVFIQEWMKTQTDVVNARAKGVVEPTDNRFILSIGTRAFVFSYFPDEKISGWTYWDLPFEPKVWMRDERNLYVRFGDEIHIYSSDDPEDDEVVALIETNFFDAKMPAHQKDWNMLAMGVQGVWDVSIATNPNVPTDVQDVGSFINISYSEGDHPFDQRSAHIALVLECSKGGKAKITDFTVGFDGSTEEN